MKSHMTEPHRLHTSSTRPGRLAGAAAVAIALAAIALAGCNTVEGAGKDVQKVGEAVEDAAD